jgi:hypothetical protein
MRGRLRTPREALADTTEHGLVYLQRLRRAQLQLSIFALVAFGAVFGVLPIALDVIPSLRHTTILGIPIALWIMVVPLFPLFLFIGWSYQRRADALDRAFQDLVDE